MGEVFVGEHESIQTRVAIKVLHPEVSQNAEHLQRFFNEAKIVSRIKHAGIVKIFDVGSYREHAYLIMELLEGEALAARIRRTGRLSWAETVELGRQIASVLDATHRAGVIHRDLKPDNMFLVVDHELAGGERVKVLDFGISKLSGTIASGSPKTIGTMGTPAYMAPEQWGDSGNVDWRADAYSLGCALFEMVCGQPPFTVTTIADACAKHLHAAPPAPGGLVAMPEGLAALITRLLAKEPATRASSMGQVARELAQIAAAPGPLTEPNAAAALTSAVSGTVAPTLPATGAAIANVLPTALPPATTLGHSVGQLGVVPVRRSRAPWVAGLAVGALAIGGLVIALAVRSGGTAPIAPAAPAPVPAPATIAPAPEPAAPAPAPPAPAAAPPTLAAPPPPPSPEPVATPPVQAKPDHRKKPATKPKEPAPPKPGSGSGDNGFGGRI